MQGNEDFQIESPIHGQTMNMRFICGFYERLVVEEYENQKVYLPIKFWYNTEENKSGLHQVFVVFAGEESKEIAVFTGFYFNPVEKVNIKLLKDIAIRIQNQLN